jgi:hypothetical protein
MEADEISSFKTTGPEFFIAAVMLRRIEAAGRKMFALSSRLALASSTPAGAFKSSYLVEAVFRSEPGNPSP